MKKRNLVFLCSFFFSLSGNILNFSLIFRLTDRFSFTPGQVGAYVAFGQLFYFLGCNLYRLFVSGNNPAKVFTVSSIIAFLTSLPLGYVQVRPLVYVSYWVLQLSIGSFWPPVMAWLTSGLDAAELNKVISRFNRSWMAASIVGPLIAGPLYRWNSQVNFFFINLGYFTVAFIIFLLRRGLQNLWEGDGAAPVPASAAASATSAPEKRVPPPEHKSLDKKLDIYRYRGWITAFCGGMIVGVLVNIVPLHIRDGLGYTERSAGLVLFTRCVAGFAGFGILARFTFWHFKRWWSIFLQGGLILSALFFLAGGNRFFFYFAIVIFFGLVNSGCYTNSMFYCGATGKSPKKNMAFHEIFIAVGTAAGAAGGGATYQRFGFAATCAALAFVLALGMGLLVFLNRKELPIAAPWKRRR